MTHSRTIMGDKLGTPEGNEAGLVLERLVEGIVGGDVRKLVDGVIGGLVRGLHVVGCDVGAAKSAWTTH